MHRNLTRAALAAAFFQAFSVAAANDEAAVVVTATRQPTRASELLSDVTVIRREDLAGAGQSTLSDFLQTLPGIEVVSYGGPGQPGSIFIRGAKSEHTVVIVDGLRINSATMGLAAFEHIPLAAVERIEVLRGPASSLYGADAIGGVIQIFTRRAGAEPRLSASLGTGSFGTTTGDLAFGRSFGAVSADFHASTQRSQGFSAIRAADPNYAANFFTDPYNPDRDGYRNDTAGGRLAVKLAAGHEIGMQHYQTDALVKKDAVSCDPFFIACTAAYDSRTRQQLAATSLFMSNRFLAGWTSTLRAGITDDAMTDYRYEPGGRGEYRQQFRTEQQQLLWQNDIVLGPGALLLAAEQVQQQIRTSTTYAKTRRTIDSLLAGWNGWFGNHGLQASARRDDNDQFGARTTGALSYAYRIAPAWRVGVSARSAFKAPSFNDLYFPVDPISGGGNPALKPERSRSHELSVKYEAGGHAFDAVLYRQSIDDLIEWRPLGSPFYWTPQNVSRALLRGLTLGYRFDAGEWRVRASLDVQDPRDLNRDVVLNNRTQAHGALAVSRQLGAWRLGAELVAAGARYEDSPFDFTVPPAVRFKLDGYSVANLTADYAFARDWSLFARANNIFDERYQVRYGYATAPANLFVGIRYDAR